MFTPPLWDIERSILFQPNESFPKFEEWSHPRPNHTMIFTLPHGMSRSNPPRFHEDRQIFRFSSLPDSEPSQFLLEKHKQDVLLTLPLFQKVFCIVIN